MGEARLVALRAFLDSESVDKKWKDDFRIASQDSEKEPAWTFMIYNPHPRRPGDFITVSVNKSDGHVELKPGE
jgi:hypothetical protein